MLSFLHVMKACVPFVVLLPANAAEHHSQLDLEPHSNQVSICAISHLLGTVLVSLSPFTEISLLF